MIIIVWISCLFPSLLQAKDMTTKTVDTDITLVTLYLNGAEVSRETDLSITEGRTKLVVHNLSEKIDINSIRATTSNEVAILSVATKVNRFEELQHPIVEQVEDSLTDLMDNITILNNELEAYEKEKELLAKNNDIGGEETGVAITELKQAADFYRSRIKDINDKSFAIKKKLQQQKKDKQKLIKRQQQVRKQFKSPKTTVFITVKATQNTNFKLTLRYLVKDAVWSPTYNLRATDITAPITLEYKAKVYNNTGIDWNNVLLKLSTGDPTRNADKPRLETWRLNYNTTQSLSKKSYNLQQQSNGEGRLNTSYQYNNLQNQALDLDNIPAAPTFEEVEVAELNAEFEIEEPYTIPSDATPYTVEVTEHDLPANYKHFAIPKMDKGVFLLAQVTGWEDLNLIAGPANVYYKDTYLGQSNIETRSVKDTLDLSLGRDSKVVVTRVKRKDKSGKKFLGTNIKEALMYEMIIKNNRKEAINITIQDQVPVAQDKDIQVSIEEISKAKHDELSGKLTWKYELKAGASQKITTAFSVKYPKSKNVIIRKSRKVYSPRF